MVGAAVGVVMNLHEILGASVSSSVCLCCPAPRVTGLLVCQACWDARQPGGRAEVVDPVVDAVCALLLARSRLGMKKYGTTLADHRTDRRTRLQHALEEAADLTCYLMWEIMEHDKE